MRKDIGKNAVLQQIFSFHACARISSFMIEDNREESSLGPSLVSGAGFAGMMFSVTGSLSLPVFVRAECFYLIFIVYMLTILLSYCSGLVLAAIAVKSLPPPSSMQTISRFSPLP